MEWRKYIVLALLFLFFCKVLVADDGQAHASIIQDNRFSQDGLYLYSLIHPVNTVVEITNPLNGISRTASVLAGSPSGNVPLGLSPQLANELSIQYPTLVYYRSIGGDIDLPYHPDPDVNPGAGIITEFDLPLVPSALPPSSALQDPAVSSVPFSEDLAESSPSPSLQDAEVLLSPPSEGLAAPSASSGLQDPEVSSVPDSEVLAEVSPSAELQDPEFSLAPSSEGPVAMPSSPELQDSEVLLAPDSEGSSLSPELQDLGVPLTADSEGPVAMPSSPESQGPEVSLLPESEGLDASLEEEMLQGDVEASPSPELQDPGVPLTSDSESPVAMPSSAELQGPEVSLLPESEGLDASPEEEIPQGDVVPLTATAGDIITSAPFLEDTSPVLDDLQVPQGEDTFALDSDPPRPASDEAVELFAPIPFSRSSPLAEDELRGPLGESGLAMEIPEQRESMTEDGEVAEFYDGRSMPEFDEAVELATPDPFSLSSPSLNGELQRSLGESDFVIDQPQQKDPAIEAADEQFIIPELSSDDFTLNAPERSTLPFKDNIPSLELQDVPFLVLPEIKDTEQPAAAQDTEQDESIEEQFTLMDIEATPHEGETPHMEEAPHEEESTEQTTQLASSGIEEEVRVEQPIEATHTFNQDAYYAQVGAYESKNNADGVHEELGGEFPSFVYKDDEERILYKVFIGPVSSDERGIMRYLLKAKGFTSFFRKGDTFF